MASTTSELGGEKQSWSLSPASTPAALVLGLKRQSGQWPETFPGRDYGTFLPAHDFSYSIWNSGTKEKHPRCLPASTRSLKLIARNSSENPSALDPRSSDRSPVLGSRDEPVRRRAAPDLAAPVLSILAKRFDRQIVFQAARARQVNDWIAPAQRSQASVWIEQMQLSPGRASLSQRRCQAEVSRAASLDTPNLMFLSERAVNGL
jgi:hypothetical protein